MDADCSGTSQLTPASFDGVSSLSPDSARPQALVEKEVECDDGDIVRRSFMPGILSTVPRSVRQAFKPICAPSRRRKGKKAVVKTLGPGAPKVGQTCVSKFLSGQGTSFLNQMRFVVAHDAEEDGDESDDDEPAAKEEEFKPHEPLVLYEPNEDERAHGAETIEVPPILCQFLRPHQREGVQFVFECIYGLKDIEGCGSILADDMGLGKTLQSLTVLYTMLKSVDARKAGVDLGCAATKKDRLIAKRAVVVCPCSLVKNWEAEFDKWINSRATSSSQRVECMALAESSRKTVEAMLDQFLAPSCRYDVLVISYETFRAQANRFVKKDAALLKSARKTSPNGCVDLIICDEAHRLKNADAQTSTALASLACQRRILLSGTPMQNDLVEFYAMVNFTNPGIFGSKEAFVKKYERPILRGREPDATDKQKSAAAERQKQLSAIADKFIIRRMNRLNARHLPPKLTQVVCCALTEPQRAMYQYLIQQREREHASEGSVKDALGYVQLLQKVCNHPSIVTTGSTGANSDPQQAERAAKLTSLLPAGSDAPHTKTGTPAEDDLNAPRGRGGRILSRHLYDQAANTAKAVDPSFSGKMRVLHALMRALFQERKERIVVVSVYMTTLDLIEAMCENEGWPSCKLGGSTPAKRRKKYNDEFNDPNSGYFAFLLSSKAGGCGLNLIGGSRLVMFDLDWNPATDKQAAARCWRDGQKLQCYTYRFVSTGTLEERMLQRQLSKEGLQNVIEDKEQVNHFSTDDLKRLFEYQRHTVSDLHDELQCSECTGKHAARKLTDTSKVGLGQAACALCVDWFKSDVLSGPFAHPALLTFPEVSAIANIEQLPKISRKIDLTQIVAKLEMPIGGYAKVADVTKDVHLIVKNAAKLWNKTDQAYIAAQEFHRHLEIHWKRLSESMLDIDAAEKAEALGAQSAAGDGAVKNSSTVGEAAFKKQLYPLPKEEDLNNWSHHASVDTIEDPVFKRAMRDIPGAVTFVFGPSTAFAPHITFCLRAGMYQDWDLIEVDMARARADEEARKQTAQTEAPSPDREHDDHAPSHFANQTMSPTLSKRHKKDVQVLRDSTNVPCDDR